MKLADAMEFFRQREGEWESWRVTHHLAFRRAESGESVIKMECLDKDDERIKELCSDWDEDPATAQGGCYVTWRATLAWDQEGENHEGSTTFALVPTSDDARRGKLIRDRGYAEIVPIAGTYYMDEDDNLNLETPYEGGEVMERFSFDGTDVVNRFSTVRRFGGFSTATFATERRVGSEGPADPEEVEGEDFEEFLDRIMLFGMGRSEAQMEPKGLVHANRFGKFSVARGKPSSNSAFGSGFGGSNEARGAVKSAKEDGATNMVGEAASIVDDDVSNMPEGKQGDFMMASNGSNGAQGAKGSRMVDGVSDRAAEAASKAGVEMANVPPSMRPDFLAGLSGSRGVRDAEESTQVEGVSSLASEAAVKAGIDLSKVPPSMRDDFIASFEKTREGGDGSNGE